MAKRTLKRTAVKRKKISLTPAARRKENNANKKAQLLIYNTLKKRAQDAFKKLKADFKKQVLTEKLIDDVKNLLIPLGESNFIAEELKLVGKKTSRSYKRAA